MNVAYRAGFSDGFVVIPQIHPQSIEHGAKGEQNALLPYPRRTSTGWTTPASPGALRILFSGG
jgi:hypothetical protein